MEKVDRAMLQQTKPCAECGGIGEVEKKKCDGCAGAGVLTDNVIPELVKRFAQSTLQAKRMSYKELADVTAALYGYMADKLDEAYERGYKQAQSEAKENHV